MTIVSALLLLLAGATVTLIVLTWMSERSHKLDHVLEQAEAEMVETYVPIESEPYAPSHSQHAMGLKTRRIDPAAVRRAIRDE